MPPPVAQAKGASGRAGLPFGYRLERDAILLVVRRRDGSFVAAFPARDADPFEVEAAVWEDAE